ncbi:hypothetical protein [Thalassospira xiamenensis]|uniref:hypothetical protein n=1 Tax=Thalassospira xiamenensis TaxID=220697 RepID=UPI001E4D6BA3|nr:hypothetical protein [Thalassospira xiamenensis]MCD1593335.1 hypothetical protein [Thalassospira xiamenensis]
MADMSPTNGAGWTDVAMHALDLVDKHAYLVFGTLVVLVLLVVRMVPMTTRELTREVMQGLKSIIDNKDPIERDVEESE